MTYLFSLFLTLKSVLPEPFFSILILDGGKTYFEFLLIWEQIFCMHTDKHQCISSNLIPNKEVIVLCSLFENKARCHN